jgi:hypothetical protein
MRTGHPRVTPTRTTPIYFHIGYSKTGTKALQGQVFRGLDRLHLWANGPLVWSYNDEPQREAVTLLRELAWSERWDPTDAKWESLRNAATPTDGRVSFASYETLSGTFYEPRSDGEENIRRLHQLFPSMRVILVIREQRSMLRSTYAEYVRVGGPGSRERFLNGGIVEPACLLYDAFVQFLHDRLGADNVKVLLYEEFVSSPASFLSELGRFAGIDDLGALAQSGGRRVHVSLADPSLSVLRLVNRCFVRSELQARPIVASETLARAGYSGVTRVVNPLVCRLGRAAASADHWIPRSIAERVGPSNAALAARCGLPLDRYDYLTS